MKIETECVENETERVENEKKRMNIGSECVEI